VVRTRLVAQILLRYTEWRQKYVARSTQEKSSTPLGSHEAGKVEHAIPYRRTLVRFAKGIVCLGIPYLVEPRDAEAYSSTRPTDEEDQGGPEQPRSDDAGLGNSQPLVAALLLSASVTFLAFPGLNETSRVAALISALCAAASMVSYVITLHGRSHPRVIRAKGTILASLPLVMLAYSLCAFVVGVVAYSLEGNPESNRGGGFGRFTGWIVVAVWIALVAILAASATVMKKGL